MYSKRYRSDCVFFAELKPDGDHFVYLSAYGTLARELLEKYVEDQRTDNEKLFAEWDESVNKATLKVGFTVAHPVEDGFVYISAFQEGIGLSSER